MLSKGSFLLLSLCWLALSLLPLPLRDSSFRTAHNYCLGASILEAMLWDQLWSSLAKARGVRGISSLCQVLKTCTLKHWVTVCSLGIVVKTWSLKKQRRPGTIQVNPLQTKCQIRALTELASQSVGDPSGRRDEELRGDILWLCSTDCTWGLEGLLEPEMCNLNVSWLDGLYSGPWAWGLP